MLDPLTLIEVLATVISTIVAIVPIIIYLTKKPHLTFALQRAVLKVVIEGKTENVSILLARVSNLKKRFSGDTAKGTECSILRTALIKDRVDPIAFISDLPWLQSYETELSINSPINTDLDLLKVLETQVFRRMPQTIPQGHSQTAIVMLAFERSNRFYWATNPPEELRISKEESRFIIHPFQLEVAGENAPSTASNGTLLIPFGWNNWSYPNKVALVRTPSKIMNFLLNKGLMKRQEPVIESDLGELELKTITLIKRR